MFCYIEDLTRVLMFLLILLNELRKRHKMRGLPSILSIFGEEFNEFNNKRAQMFDFIYHMTLTPSLPYPKCCSL